MTLAEFLHGRRGRTRDLAAKLGVSASLVTQWAAGKPLPAIRAAQIERSTAGELLRWDLRPDDWHLIWPELVGAEGAPPVPAEVADGTV